MKGAELPNEQRYHWYHMLKKCVAILFLCVKDNLVYTSCPNCKFYNIWYTYMKYIHDMYVYIYWNIMIYIWSFNISGCVPVSYLYHPWEKKINLPDQSANLPGANGLSDHLTLWPWLGEPGEIWSKSFNIIKDILVLDKLGDPRLKYSPYSHGHDPLTTRHPFSGAITLTYRFLMCHG